MELFKNLGFVENPFSTFSAEDEKSFLSKIYINPLFYETLKSDLINSHSRFILGARGIGKTALILQLKSALKKENVFTIIIDDFDNIPLNNNESDLTRLIIETLVTKLCIQISKSPVSIKKLNKSQKEKLSFIVKEFFKTLSKSDYEKMYNKTDRYKTRNLFRNIYNYIFNKPINLIISGSLEIVSDAARKSLGLPTVNENDFYKNYLPELTIEQIQKEANPQIFLANYKLLKSILNDLAEIIKALGFKTTVVFFDKIDEYKELSGSITAVAQFLENFLKDTTILMNSSYALVFSLWEVLKPDLTNRGVRFDKIKPINITWQNDNLRKILDERIKYFSNQKKTSKDIIKNNNLIDSIISLSNNSPRYLFRQLSYIYDYQSEIDSSSTELSADAIEKGQLEFSIGFEYYAIYPSKRGSKDDIHNNINKLLKIGKEVIMTKDFVEVFKVSTPTAISYIKIVQEYNLVKEKTETASGAKMYEIQDPVIKHLIKSKISEIKK